MRHGESTTVIVPIGTGTGLVEFVIEPTFQPSAQGDSDDARTLGCLCRGCWMVSHHPRESLLKNVTKP